jgi:DNA-binding NarL/FixJ family response regulator
VPRVGIVEDHLLLAETLKAGLAQRGVETMIISPSGEGTDLLADLLAARLDLALLDLDLGAFGDSTRLVAPLVTGGVRVLIVTGSTDRLRIARALEQGAIGYQLKSSGFEELLDRATAALTADGPLDPAEQAGLLEDLRRRREQREQAFAPFDRLTRREQATLRALGDGRTVNQIARQWVVSESTVRSHVRGILDKLGANSQLAAVAAAERSGWFAAAGAPTRQRASH